MSLVSQLLINDYRIWFCMVRKLVMQTGILSILSCVSKL